MDLEDQRNLSPIPPSGCFGLWVIGWLLVTAVGIGCYLYYRPRPVVDDWPDGGSANTDHWNRGVFLSYPADRIRRVADYSGQRVNVNSIHYFAAIPMDDMEYARKLGEWRLSSNLRESSGSSLPDYHNSRPDWFPDSEYRVGTVTEYTADGPIHYLFRKPGDNHLYIQTSAR